MQENQLATEHIVRPLPGGVVVSVHVQPRAFRTESAGIHGHALKIRVAAQPTGGAANGELRRFLARRCEVALSAVEILSGAGSRRKCVLVKGPSVKRMRELLQLDASDR